MARPVSIRKFLFGALAGLFASSAGFAQSSGINGHFSGDAKLVKDGGDAAHHCIDTFPSRWLIEDNAIQHIYVGGGFGSRQDVPVSSGGQFTAKAGDTELRGQVNAQGVEADRITPFCTYHFSLKRDG